MWGVICGVCGVIAPRSDVRCSTGGTEPELEATVHVTPTVRKQIVGSACANSLSPFYSV